MRYQLCSRDEYGQSQILATSSNLEAILKQADTQLYNDNLDNIFSLEEKSRNWESCFIELVDKDSNETVEDAVYAGTVGGKSTVQRLKTKETLQLADCDVKTRILIGTYNKKKCYAKDEYGREITSLNSGAMQGKTVYFLKVID